MEYTEHLGLKKPAASENYSIPIYNQNADAIDTAIAAKGSVKTGIGMMPAGSAQVTVGDAFISDFTRVLIFPNEAVKTQFWEVSSVAGSFTVVADDVEPNDVEFTWFAMKPGVV